MEKFEGSFLLKNNKLPHKDKNFLNFFLIFLFNYKIYLRLFKIKNVKSDLNNECI